MRAVVLCCLLLAGTVLCEMKSYRGHQVISVKAENQEQLKVLQQLQDNFDLIFLGDPSPIRETEIVVPPDQMVEVFKTLKAAKLPVTLVSADMQTDIDAVMEENTRNQLMNARAGPELKNGRYSPAHNFYRTWTQVNSAMESFAGAYPDLVQRKKLDYASEEGEDIHYLELGTNSSKPVILIEGLAHAREWIVTASLIYVIDTMLSDYSAGSANNATYALDNFYWLIIPVVNPDGYKHTWTSNRMWRKNRKYISSRCTGIDLNRNYDVEFGGVGASSNCQSDTYHGANAFSEAETMNVKALFDSVRSRVRGFLSVHAYSQLLLYPWGYVNSNNDPNPPSNLAELINVGNKMKNGLDSNGKTYSLGTAYGVLGYAAAGAAEDWALTDKSGILAYCYELRPATYSQGGFDIPASEIIPTGEELLESLYALARNA